MLTNGLQRSKKKDWKRMHDQIGLGHHPMNNSIPIIFYYLGADVILDYSLVNVGIIERKWYGHS